MNHALNSEIVGLGAVQTTMKNGLLTPSWYVGGASWSGEKVSEIHG